jgi:hypothetical protein
MPYKVLIQLLVSTTCFEQHLFINRINICMSHAVLHNIAPARLLAKCMTKTTLKPTCANDFPDDKQMISETRRRHQELN